MFKKALLCILTGSFSLYAARILVSDPAKPQESFSFNIAAHDLYIPFGRFFVAASEKVNGNSFSVAAVGRNETKFTALTPPKVKLNSEADKDNPLFGAAISHLALFGSRALVAKSDLPSSLFLIDEQQIAVYEASDIHDAQGKTANALLALTTSAPAVTTPLELDAEIAAFAAIGNSQGNFDGNGSGIALLFFKRFVDKKKNLPFFVWDIYNAQTGVSQFTNEGLPHAGGNQALPFGKDTPELFLNSPLTALGRAVDLHYDRDLGRLYIAVQAEGGADEEDGARSIVMAGVASGQLLLRAIAPDTAFDANNKIVGGRGAHAITTIYKVRTLQTRTYLRYLIVVGGNGAGEELKRQVYSLPLVDNIMAAAHGTLANVQSDPFPVFAPLPPHSFQGRVFDKPAVQPKDLFTGDSLPARVGGDGQLPGPITDIVVSSEAVMVSVEQPVVNGEALQPGIFYSQPLFDVDGRIRGWTRWQRVAGTNDSIAGFRYDPVSGVHTFIPRAPAHGPVVNSAYIENPIGHARTHQVAAGHSLGGGGSSKGQGLAAPQTHNVLRTDWTDGTDELGTFISRALTLKTGGVQSLSEFPYTTPSFSSTPGLRLGVQAYTGFEKVILLQSGKDEQLHFGPFVSVINPYSSTDGSLKNFEGSSALVLSGGALTQLGPISSTAVITDGVDGWFVVGGSGGVAILADEQGHGWNARVGLQTQFKELRSAMAWRQISQIPNVRKIIAINNRLFVLTDQVVERYEISSRELAVPGLSDREATTLGLSTSGVGESGKSTQSSSITMLPAVTIAALTEEDKQQARSYSDLVVSGPLALLATSFGLLRSGNGVDIQMVTNSKLAGWTAVTLPESAGSLCAPGPVSRLFAITPSLVETDAAHGDMYVLNAYVGLSQALIYRLTIDVGAEGVTDTTVQLFPDYFIKDVRTFFANLGDYRNYFVTDGALLSASRSAFGADEPLLELLNPFLKSGEINGARARVPFLPFRIRSHSMGKLIRSSASGAWLASGDFGIRVLN